MAFFFVPGSIGGPGHLWLRGFNMTMLPVHPWRAPLGLTVLLTVLGYFSGHAYSSLSE
jgi:hypothetical protein